MKQMKQSSGSIQDDFLGEMVETKRTVNIFLVNGIKLVGHVTKYDQYSVELDSETPQVVFKRAISTILPV